MAMSIYLVAALTIFSNLASMEKTENIIYTYDIGENL